jgi:hypothetical protein
VSFIDPDYREQLQRDQEKRAEGCKHVGHTWTKADLFDRCTRCNALNPESQKPRITLRTDAYRVIWKPADDALVIESRSVDSLGAERWDHVETISASRSRSDAWPAHLFDLLTKGRRP